MELKPALTGGLPKKGDQSTSITPWWQDAVTLLFPSSGQNENHRYHKNVFFPKMVPPAVGSSSLYFSQVYIF